MTSYQVKVIDSKVYSPRNCYSKYAIECLEQGQGITVGNSLRRVMLSDLEGIAITAVRITDANHEFSTIPGVREDVIEILLNLKELVFKGDLTETQIGRLKVQGPGVVTAGQFDLPPQLHLVDPQQYVATISGNSMLEIEIHLEKGFGYRIVEKRSNLALVKLLSVDAVFMPVRKMSYEVEQVHSKSNSVLDRLVLEIWTNGSITPQEAVSISSQKLIDLFAPLSGLNFNILKPSSNKKDLQASQILIEELHLSVRAYNCLKRAQIHSVADLLHYSKEDLLEIKNFGQKSAQEVIDALEGRLDISLEDKESKSIENG
jgi:DNA-directed RNA polymerase subunit alpha